MRIGRYHYRLKNHNGGFTDYSMKIEILGENKKGTTYLVRYLEFHAKGNRPGYIARVYKRNVIEQGGAPVRRTTDMSNIRQPYKD